MSNKSKFIINTSAEYFDAIPNTTDIDAIREFYENDDITIIAATHNDGKIKFHHRVPTDEVSLLFYKIPQVEKSSSTTISATTSSSSPSSSSTAFGSQAIGMLTLEGGMVKSIYNSVSRVFSPHGDVRRAEYSPEISGLLENLHVSLGSTLGLPQTGIITIKDEINYWNQKLINATKKLDREQAQRFCVVLEKIDTQIRQIDHNSLNTIEEFLDSAHNNLDELWRLPFNYPQNRMTDLMDIICNRILEMCTENLLMEDVWSLSSYHVNNLMSQAVDVVNSWMQLCDSLTRLFWPNYSQHPWTGLPHMPKRGQLFKDRLAEIRNIKNLYKQIVTLLNDDDVRNIFSWNSPLKNINIFDTSAIGQNKWNKALVQFEQILEPIDERIAHALKGQLHTYLSNPRQVIFIFSKYETLIQRPSVLELLTIEREQFIQSLHILLQDLRKAMNDTNMEPDTGHLSVICNECRWLKVVQYQIQEIEKVSHLISGRQGYEQIIQTVQELKEETESLLRTNFEIWCGQSSTAVKSGELKLREDQPVVKFEKEGRQLMRVTFNPKLVTFCQDVREFENLGYNVPIELRASATHAAKFMSYARRLQQISTFHNTIGDRMIPCQRPIMLKNAIELSKLVQSETVAWNDEESVQRYVSTLQTAVSKLSADNNLLVGYHEQAKRTVLKLMNTDLFTQGQIWKDEMRHLRELVGTLESQGFSNLDAFKLHWDHQLYKVLEYQYIVGLVDMNNKLPDIHVDIVFRQRQLCFRPAEEEVREKYFTQQRRFIERPLGFRGLSDKSGDLFKTMVERNRHYFGPLFEKAEMLFQKLSVYKNLWTPWVALGCVDIEQLCNVHLNKWEDWDANFKACKLFSQQIAKIQESEEPIDCFVINISPLRSDIEFISRRYWEALSSSLRTSILNDIAYIQDFLQTSLQFLQNVPMDEESITESGMKYEKMISELPKVSECLIHVKGKDTCLAGWCKERVSSLSGILTQWEKLQPLIENHAVILQRQVDIIKDHANTQIHNLRNESEKLILRWESTVAELEANENASLDLLKERQEHWKNIQEKKEKLVENCLKFNMVFPNDLLQPFIVIEEKIKSQSGQWQIYDDFLSALEKILSEEWAIYRRRPYVLSEFLTKWEGSIHSSIDLPSKRIRQTVEKYQSALPVLQQLQSDALTERHWAIIFQMLRKPIKPMHNIILKDILEDITVLMQASSEIQNLIRTAASEQIVRQALAELDQWAVTANLKLINHIDSSGNSATLIKDYQEILNKIGDNQSLLISAKNSAAFDAFSDQAELWESRLNILDSILSSLNQSQRRWVYLEPVFAAGTLQNEEALFKRIDKDFRFIMKEIQNDPRVVSLIKINNINAIVNSLENQLTRCQNNLVTYIMEKRNSFPRFYFLGDDDLLEILGQAAKEDIIQKHIRKLFPGCQSLAIERIQDTNIIKAIHSADGDIVTLTQSVRMTGPIENWLNELVISIQNTLKDQIVQCYGKIGNLSEEIIRKYPSQVLCTARAIHFTEQTEKAISSVSLAKIQKTLTDEITKFANIKNQTNDHLMQIKISGLLYDLVYYVTIIDYLNKENVTSHGDWHWLQQIKFYLSKDSKVTIKMVFAEFEYSYEYLGNQNRLVNTSLTHKCYLILTQAIHMGLGGNPFGPAGTGKTECVKALGGMMGRMVLVFNCDENVDTEAMGLILTGLARCGAWGCFDEFNRLKETTLSAISMLIQPIQTALKEKTESVYILEKNIKINHHCGIFVTLNPAGEEYGGRQKLPGNIQALFRPIVMQRPEPREISRVMLFVEGFQMAHEIGDRIVELFDLSQKMLSAQKHYDWGLRELKTILLACGRELREYQKESEEKRMEADFVEMTLVVQALRSNTMSKLTVADTNRFDMLLKNVFPEIVIRTKPSSTVLSSIEKSFAALGLHSNERQIEKCLQLYEQLIKRMGVVVVGPPGSGKTTLMSILKHALIATGQIIKTYTISPKSMDRIQLLGKLDPDTRQWTDGVLTTTAVAVNAEPSHISSWIICDGDIDPEWIEALNSVLDDNKLLTLPSGWRIQFGNNVNFIFETHDVSHASPATISRMGILNLSLEDLPQNIIIESFLENEEYADLLHSFVTEIFYPALQWIEKEYLNSFASISRICLVKSVFQQITKVQNKDEFCVCIVKSLLGFIPTHQHNDFANSIYQRANIFVANPNLAEFTYYNKSRDSIEIFQSDSISNSFELNSDSKLIKTAQVKSYLEILKGFLECRNCTPFLIVGPSGSGKTLLIQNSISDFAGFQLITINCSTQLTPAYILHCLKNGCVTVSGLRGRELKPQQLRVVLFLKNLDLCYIDAWGTCSIIELLLQLIQRGGFYNENLEWICVSGIQICGSVSDMTTHLKRISPRFLSINNFLRVMYPTDGDMEIIVQYRFEPILNAFRNTQNIPSIVSSLMEFFAQIQSTFKPKPGSAHYNFTPKIIMNLIESLKCYPEDNLNDAILCELSSIFKDRLATHDDRLQYYDILRSTMRQFVSVEKEKTFFVPNTNSHIKTYQYYNSEQWIDEIHKLITISNSENYLIEEPITKELFEATAKISRVISRPNCHLTMVGRPGSRLIDSLFLAATMNQIKIHIPQGANNYTLQDFYNDLKLAMQTAALENQNTCLLIDHCWISYLPDLIKPIEAILEGSEILDLFGDDLESIASSLKHSAQLEGYQESLGTYFMNRAKKNLHLVIVFDSTSDKIDEYFNVYPALYRNTEFLYATEISSTTLTMLPRKFIEELTDGRDKIPISSYFLDILSVAAESQPPLRVYQLIKSYVNIFDLFQDDIQKRLGKLQMGVDKLASAHKVVDSLKSNAVKQEVALAEKRKLANEALEMISATMRNANDQKSSMLELKKKTQINSEQLKERQKAIQIELSEVEPILQEASAAVGQIKSEALSEIRSLRAPPDAIRDILEGVLRLMGIRDTSWNSMKTFLAKRGVKEDIRSLDPARINPENCEAVEKLLIAKADSFDSKNAKRASAAAAPLACWVIASVKYSKVIQSIKPLQREQNELQKNLELAESELLSVKTGLDDVDARVKELSGHLNSYTQEAAVLELKLEEARNTLTSSEILVQKLSSEFQSWNIQLEEYRQSFKTLDTKSLFISLAINYYSALTYDRRKATFQIITDNLHHQEFDITKNLLTEQEQIIWESMGLTRDAQVIENASILTKMLTLPFGSYPIPLIIDPSETAFMWLKEYLISKNNLFEITTQNNDRLSYILELAVRFGKILIVNDCQDLRPPLMQMMSTRTYIKFNKKLIEVGTKLVDLHENFKLILFTKTDKIDIKIETKAYLTYIPFTVTTVGLTDQLLSKTIILKSPELEQKRIELLRNEGNLLKKRIELEDKLLEELSSAQGDILKNENLLKTLNEVKESSSRIDESLKESAIIKATVINEYNQYKALCSNAANFFMGLSKMYDISPTIFTKIYLKSIGTIDKSDEKKVYNYLVRSTFQYLSRSTPKESHLTLGMFICKNAFPNQIPNGEWELFVTNFMSSSDGGSRFTCPSWIDKEMAPKIVALFSQCPQLEGNLQLDQQNKWRSYVEDKNTSTIPVSVSHFSSVLITQIFRSELLSDAMSTLVSNLLGINIESAIQPTMEQLIEESSSSRPILVITEPESDPSTEIRNLAIKKLGQGNYMEMSIGKGMERVAIEKIKKSADVGHWICIKNVHLIPYWLIDLDRELENMKKSDNFRLWIICESTRGFSEAVMYKFVKILFEFPNGLKNKIRRLVQQYTNSLLVQGKDAKLTKLRIVMFILNSVLQERRSYIPQGWSKWYEFGDSDLRAGLEILKWLEGSFGSSRVDWKILQKLCGNVAYGGRINNLRDLEVLDKYLEEFFNNDVLNSRWSPLSLNINISTTSNIQEYVNCIQKFPDTDNPELFCLSSISNVSRDVARSKNIIRALRTNFYNSEENGNMDKRVKPILSLWKKLAAKTTISKTYDGLDETKAETPWEAFVVYEMEIAGSCFQEVHSTLAIVHSLIKDRTSMGRHDEQLVYTLAENQVPLSWKKIWSGPMTAVEYLKSLISKATEAVRRFNSDIHFDFAEKIDLSTVFNPSTFISCLKLANAEKLMKSSKNLELRSSVSAISGTVVVRLAPLKVDGASFQSGKLIIYSKDTLDNNKSSEFYITFQEVNSKISQSKLERGFINLPLYSNVSREKMICNLQLPTEENSDTILLSGAALVITDF